jgi:hypothetical protein
MLTIPTPIPIPIPTSTSHPSGQPCIKGWTSWFCQRWAGTYAPAPINASLIHAGISRLPKISSPSQPDSCNPLDSPHSVTRNIPCDDVGHSKSKAVVFVRVLVLCPKPSGLPNRDCSAVLAHLHPGMPFQRGPNATRFQVK